MKTNEIEINRETVDKIHSLLDAGLTKGLGEAIPGQMCVEAAVCAALGLPHSDDPPCVGVAIRAFKIRLNDAPWSSNRARAEGMRKLAIAQLGSNELDQIEFSKKLAMATINKFLPVVLAGILAENLIEDCRKAGTLPAAREAAWAAAEAAAEAAEAAARGAARAAAREAAWAAEAAAREAAWEAAGAAAEAARGAARGAAGAARGAARDKYLCLSAEIGLEVLLEMNSPGAAWL